MNRGGGPLVELKDPNVTLINAPPLAIIVDQEIVQDQTVTSDGIARKSSHVDQILVGFSCSSSDDGVCIYPLDIEMMLPSPSAFPERRTVALTEFLRPSANFEPVSLDSSSRPAKKAKSSNGDRHPVVNIAQEVSTVASFVSRLVHDESSEGN